MIAKGIAIWPHLNEPDDRFDPPAFKCNLLMSAEEAKPLIAALSEVQENKHASECAEQNKKTLKKYQLPFDDETDEAGNPTGNIMFKFKLPAMSKKGVPQRLRLVDAKKDPMNERVGMGSSISIAFDAYGWYTPALGVGVSLRMNAVQVTSLKERGGSVDEFDVEDGFETTATLLSDSNASTDSAGYEF